MTPEGALQPARHVVEAGRRFALWTFDVALACCAVEVLAASVAVDDAGVPRLGAVPSAGDPADAQVLLVSGTVTTRLAPAVRALYDRMPGPRFVVAYGACASSGGPYWDSPTVVNGVHELLPVDLWVPGCPPRPQALLDALLELDARSSGVAPAPAAAPTELLR